MQATNGPTWNEPTLRYRAAMQGSAPEQTPPRRFTNRAYFSALRSASMMDWLSAGRSDAAMKLYVWPEFKMM